jgi:hypothetical protein
MKKMVGSVISGFIAIFSFEVGVVMKDYRQRTISRSSPKERRQRNPKEAAVSHAGDCLPLLSRR